MEWRKLDKAGIEHHYNPRVTIPNFEDYINRYPAMSRAARQRLTGELNLRYGDGPKETFDLFRPAAPGGPLLIFFHGGYWRTLDKDDFSFMAEVPTAAGATVAVVNYDLCPAVNLVDIVAETIRAVGWLADRAAEFGADPARIHVAGHSAGAHLAAMALAHDWAATGRPADLIKGAVLITGVYDTEPAIQLDINEDMRLTPKICAQCNAMQAPSRPGTPVTVIAGAKEPAGWIAQSTAYHAAAGLPGEVVLVPGADHFSLAIDLADPTSVVTRAILEQMGLG